jgi:hypothetical protein
MNYYNIPFDSKNAMIDYYIMTVTSKVMKHKDEGKMLTPCSSKNKVALWLGAHFKKDHKFSNEKSLRLAKILGLTNTAMEKN